MWRLARVLASLYIRKDNLTMRRKKNKRIVFDGKNISNRTYL